MSYALTEITGWLRAQLAPEPIADYGPNGLQVEASSEVRRIVTGVTANLALIKAATALRADVLVVHHGIYWDGAPFTVTGALGRRIRALIEARMSLVAYHLPLDGHPTLGNAVGLARTLGLEDLTPDFEHRGVAVGCVGRFPRPLTADTLRARLEAHFGPRALLFAHGPERIQTAGIVTGGAPRDVHAAVARGLDLFVTGEVGEYSQADAAEEHIHFAACGHHRSERFGPRALADALAEHFPALEDVRFVDIDNPA